MPLPAAEVYKVGQFAKRLRYHDSYYPPGVPVGQAEEVWSLLSHRCRERGLHSRTRNAGLLTPVRVLSAAPQGALGGPATAL